MNHDIAMPAIISVTDKRRISARQQKARGIMLGLSLGLVVTVFAAVGCGAVRYTPAEIVSLLARPDQTTVLWAIRLPRVIYGLLIGTALAMAGAALQALLRNPLADPGLLGVSSGAAVAACGVIMLGHFIRPASLSIAAFAGGLLATLAVYKIGRGTVATMLLAGIAINALCLSGIGLFTFLATDVQLRSLTFWSLGSLGGATWAGVQTIAPLLIVPAGLLATQSRALNVFALGEAEAGHLGIDVGRVKIVVVLLVAVLVGVSVAVAGIIAFVGLIVPHCVRLWIGPDHRYLMPASAILGSALLLAADTLARTAVVPAELPVGVVTSLVGAPFFLWLVRRGRTT